MSECTISSTGFVNYFPSKERTDRKVKEVFDKYGDEVVIINGTDNWNGCKLFRIGFMLELFKIQKVDDFHNQVSGITKSGVVIKKADLETFIKKFNKQKWTIRRKEGCGEMCLTETIKIFDPDVNEWQTFFEIKYGDTEYLKVKDLNGYYKCRHQGTCTINNFKKSKMDASRYFTSPSIQWYWKSVEKFVK